MVFGPAKDFEDAPTQYGSATVILSPNPKLKSNLGYRVSAVNGSRFFTDALEHQRFAGVELSNTFPECCMDDASGVDLEG